MRDVLFLDTRTIFSSMANGELLTNICKADLPINMRTNTGTCQIDKVGTLLGFNGKIWYDKQSMANNVSFAELAKQHQISYNATRDSFKVEHDGKTIKFLRSEEGLYYYEVSKDFNNSVK